MLEWLVNPLKLTDRLSLAVLPSWCWRQAHTNTQSHTHHAYGEETRDDSGLVFLERLAACHGGPCLSCVLKMAGFGLWPARTGTWLPLDRNLAWSWFPWPVRVTPWPSVHPTRRTCCCPSRHPLQMQCISAGKPWPECLFMQFPEKASYGGNLEKEYQ